MKGPTFILVSLVQHGGEALRSAANKTGNPGFNLALLKTPSSIRTKTLY